MVNSHGYEVTNVRLGFEVTYTISTRSVNRKEGHVFGEFGGKIPSCFVCVSGPIQRFVLG